MKVIIFDLVQSVVIYKLPATVDSKINLHDICDQFLVLLLFSQLSGFVCTFPQTYKIFTRMSRLPRYIYKPCELSHSNVATRIESNFIECNRFWY